MNILLSFQPPAASCSMAQKNPLWEGMQKLPVCISKVQIFHLWCPACCQSTPRTYLKKCHVVHFLIKFSCRWESNDILSLYRMTVSLHSLFGTTSFRIPLPCIQSFSTPCNEANETVKTNLTVYPLKKKVRWHVTSLIMQQSWSRVHKHLWANQGQS